MGRFSLRRPASGRRSGRVLGIGLCIGFLTLLAGVAVGTPTSFTTIGSSGPLTRIHLGEDLSCQVEHVNSSKPAFFPSQGAFFEAIVPADCGTLALVGTALFAPDFGNHPTTATGPHLGPYTPFTPISQSAVGGTGTATNPYRVTTLVSLGSTGILLRQNDTYVLGDTKYKTSIRVENTGASAKSVVLYRGADCYLHADTGYGALGVGGAGSVACAANPDNTPPGGLIEWIPISAGSRYEENEFRDFWKTIGQKNWLANSCQCTTKHDNAAGLMWSFTVPAGGAATREHTTRFIVPGSTTLEANPAVASAVPNTGTYFPRVSARLNLTATGSPLGGETIRFEDSNGVFLCSASTDSSGLAFCGDATTEAQVTSSGGRYWAFYAGTSTYAPSKDLGTLARVAGTDV